MRSLIWVSLTRSDEGVELLSGNALRQFFVANAITGWPFSLRKEIGTKDIIEDWQMDGIICITCPLIFGVMPMMECWCDKDMAKPAKREADIGMHEDAVQSDVNHIHENDWLRKSQDEYRRQHARARDHDFTDVESRTGKPIHILGAVMNGMEAPEKWNAVHQAMGPVLGQVRNQNNQWELYEPREAAHGRLQGMVDRPGAQPADSAGRDQNNQRDKKMGHGEVLQIQAPC